MKLPYQIVGALLAVFGVFMTQQSLSLRFYTQQGPGPGLLPVFMSILVAVLGAVMFLQATFKPSDPMPADFIPGRTGAIRVVSLLGAAVALQFLMIPLGFIVSTAAFLLFVLPVIGRVKPALTVAVAVVGSVGIYLVFARWLQIPLPTGVFAI